MKKAKITIFLFSTNVSYLLRIYWELKYPGYVIVPWELEFSWNLLHQVKNEILADFDLV